MYRTHRISQRLKIMLYPYPGYGGHGRTELPVAPGTGRYECHAEFSEVPGTGTELTEVLSGVTPGKNTRVLFVRTL